MSTPGEWVVAVVVAVAAIWFIFASGIGDDDHWW